MPNQLVLEAEVIQGTLIANDYGIFQGAAQGKAPAPEVLDIPEKTVGPRGRDLPYEGAPSDQEIDGLLSKAGMVKGHGVMDPEPSGGENLDAPIPHVDDEGLGDHDIRFGDIMPPNPRLEEEIDKGGRTPIHNGNLGPGNLDPEVVDPEAGEGSQQVFYSLYLDPGLPQGCGVVDVKDVFGTGMNDRRIREVHSPKDDPRIGRRGVECHGDLPPGMESDARTTDNVPDRLLSSHCSSRRAWPSKLEKLFGQDLRFVCKARTNGDKGFFIDYHL